MQRLLGWHAPASGRARPVVDDVAPPDYIEAAAGLMRAAASLASGEYGARGLKMGFAIRLHDVFCTEQAPRPLGSGREMSMRRARHAQVEASGRPSRGRRRPRREDAAADAPSARSARRKFNDAHSLRARIRFGRSEASLPQLWGDFCHSSRPKKVRRIRDSLHAPPSCVHSSSK